MRGGLIELSIFLIAFLFLYIGGEFTLQRSAFIVGGVLFWALLALQVLRHFDISLSKVALSALVAEPRKFGIVVALFSASALSLSIFTAFARAGQTLGANVVSIERMDGKEYNCVSLIGKSAAGIFLFEPGDAPHRETAIKFLPYSSFIQAVSIGGSEFFWMRRAIRCAERGPGLVTLAD